MTTSPASPQVLRAYRLGGSRWPSIRLGLETFDARLQALGVGPDSLARQPEDLFIAVACGLGSATALAAFEKDYLNPALPALRRFGTAVDFPEEVAQVLRTKLFLGPEPRIGAYSGAGPLLAWVRIGLTRTAIDLLRSDHRHQPLEPDLVGEILADSVNAEAQLVEDGARRSLRVAIEVTLKQLSARDRMLLRLHFLDGMNIDRLATMFRIHRATVARRIVHLRRDVLAALKGTVGGATATSGSAELRSLWRLIGPDLQLSLDRLLRTSLDQAAPDDAPVGPRRG